MVGYALNRISCGQFSSEDIHYILLSLNFFLKNCGGFFFVLILDILRSVDALLADPVHYDPAQVKITYIFILLACSIFGDPAVLDPPSAGNRVMAILLKILNCSNCHNV